ncbi:hypothetical protein P8C59_000253 [Phyllachora maydis]|uniref:Uncharacterized protein n=1 Tax=Phyllachora maydis TaxID=1825666 RepID=A0AAD9HWV8_9PEZI|nr:hypothetical protein P8C59_000253 [Phyllachora maydis]
MYATRALRAFRPTVRMMRPVPNEEHVAHTASQRLRRLRKIPAELWPLGIVVGFAVMAAAYSSARHFMTDSTLRLTRQNRKGDAQQHKGEH